MTGKSARKRTERWMAEWTAGLCLLLLALAFPTLAAPPLKFQRYGLEQGLSQSVVNAIAQDGPGFLWFATQDGLNRFDGYRFTVYRHHPEEPASLSASYVAALLTDREGGLWVGTELGLDRFVPGTGQFTHEPLGLGPVQVSALLQDRAGVLWVGTRAGLLRREADGSYTRFAYAPDAPDSLSDNRVNALVEDGLGQLWVGTDDGLNRLDRAKGTFTRFLHAPEDRSSLSDNRVLALYRARSGQLWIGTGNGLNRFHLVRQNFIRYYHGEPPGSLCNDRVNALIDDEQGRLWVGTEGGLCRYRAESDDFERYEHRPEDGASLSGNDVASFQVDRGGLLWIGTYGGGLSIWNRATEQFPHYLSASEGPLVRGRNSIEGLAFDRLGRIWAGTSSAGVFLVDRARDSVRLFQHRPDEPDSLAHDSVPSILEDRYGRIWLATHGGGLDMQGPGETGFRHHRHRSEDENSLSDDRVLSLHEDREGRLWVGTESGLDRHLGDGRFERWGNRLPNSYRNVDSRVGVVLDTVDGTLWAGGEGGLLRRRPGAIEFSHYRAEPGRPGSLSHTTVLSLYEDALGTLWVGTAAGLNRVEPDGEGIRFVPVTERDGLPNGVIYAIQSERNGRLWLSTNQGLVRYDPVAGRFEHFTVRDGLQSNEFYSMGTAMAPGGELVFGGLNGFNAFHPEKVSRNPRPPAVVFTELHLYHAQGNRVQDMGGVRELSLPVGTRVFAIGFAAVDFAEPAGNRFQYRMAGFSEDWVMLDDKHELSFTDLPAGVYRLEVKAANNSGLWGDKPSVLTITVLAPWWRTGWAQLGYILVLGGSLSAGFRHWRRRRQERAERRRSEAHAAQTQRTALEHECQDLLHQRAQLEQQVQAQSDENQALTHQLHELALSDAPTELANRRYVMLERAKLWSAEPKRGHALILLDLDGFARLNRRHGHAVGDRLLGEIAALLRRLCPESATLARWGGDEFLILVPACGVDETERLAERLRQRLATQEFLFDGERRGHLSCSLGICCHAFLAGGAVAAFEQALGLAERALDAAKHTSRNAWVLCGPGQEVPSQILNLELHVEELVDAGWLRVTSSLPKGHPIQW